VLITNVLKPRTKASGEEGGITNPLHARVEVAEVAEIASNKDRKKAETQAVKAAKVRTFIETRYTVYRLQR
jgi:hypothetical protein